MTDDGVITTASVNAMYNNFLEGEPIALPDTFDKATEKILELHNHDPDLKEKIDFLKQLNEQPEEDLERQRAIHRLSNERMNYTNATGTVLPNLLSRDIIKKYYLKCRREDEELFLYKNGIYHSGGDTYVKEEVRNVIDDANTHLLNEVVTHAKTSTYINGDEFNNKPALLWFKNGILNVETFDFSGFDPELISTIQLPLVYDPKAKCPAFKKFVSEILEKKEDEKLVQEMFGYCLYKDIPNAKAFMLLGEGSNGKSVLLAVLARMLGKDNTEEATIQDICYNRFIVSNFYGKLANICADLPSDKLTTTGTFKKLTGGIDTVTADRKHKKPISFINFAKVIFAANQLPATTDTTLSFFRRWIIINFPFTFSNNPEDVKAKGYKPADPSLIHKLTTKEELQGVLVWAIKGLRRLQKNGWVFTVPDTTEKIKKEWIERTDSLQGFCQVYVEENPESYIPKEVFMEAYATYCDDNGLKVKDSSVVGRQMRTIFSKVSSERPKIEGKRERIWRGICFKSAVKDDNLVDNLDSILFCSETDNNITTGKNQKTLSPHHSDVDVSKLSKLNFTYGKVKLPSIMTTHQTHGQPGLNNLEDIILDLLKNKEKSYFELENEIFDLLGKKENLGESISEKFEKLKKLGEIMNTPDGKYTVVDK